MMAADTSVVVAAFASWHEGHEAARAAMRQRPRLPAHVVLECFSVLTRLPPPHRAAPETATAFLRARLVSSPLSLPAAAHLVLIEEATEAGLTGGAIHDALIGATAREAGAALFSRDLRAVRTYEAIGVEYELVG